MQFLHVTIQGTLCLNIIVIAESLPIVTTCCSNASWSSVAVPQSGRQVLLLKIWISILYFLYQHLDYQYAQSCMCQFLMELNIWLKMCFAKQMIKDCIKLHKQIISKIAPHLLNKWNLITKFGWRKGSCMGEIIIHLMFIFHTDNHFL